MRTHGFHVKPEQDPEEFEWLLDRVEALAPESILEVGCRMGAALCTFVRTSPRCKLAVGLDGFADGWDCSSAWPNFVDKAQIKVIKGNSHDPSVISRVSELGPFDFVFIDADHRYEHAKQDFETYLPMVRTPGILAMHDITPTVWEDVRVWPLWNEIKQRGFRTEEFIRVPTLACFGIGVIHV